MRIIFFDTNEKIIQELKKKLWHLKDLYFACMDVKTLLTNHRIDVLVSPANSFGNMEGGIDAVYSKIFPNIQDCVQCAIKKYQIDSGLGYHLPIGSALPVQTTKPAVCPILLCVPTMNTPQNIRGTDNVCRAFVGILKWLVHAMKVMPDITIACPGMGTGIGKIKPEEHAKQIAQAFKYVGKPSPNLRDDSIKGYIVSK